MAMADRKPLPVSPSDTTGQNGMPSWSRPPSSQSGPASAAPVWSLPGRLLARPVLEAAGVAVDEIGLDRAQALVVDAEAYRGVVAHVVLHDVGRRHQLVQDRHRVGVLEVHGDAALAPVAAHRDVRAHPVEVVQRVDLDHVGTEVGEHHRAPRPRDRQPEVEHAHPGQWRRRCRGRGRRHRRAAARPRRLRPAPSSVSAPIAGGAVGRRGRAGVQLVHPADLAHRTELRDRRPR